MLTKPLKQLKKTFGTSVLVLGFLAANVIPAAAQNGVLKVTSFPSGAAVTIDDVATGKVTPMSTSLTLGDHTVTVQILDQGWRPDTRTVTVLAGNNDLSVTLLPALTTGPVADGRCWSNTQRYVDCGNGTVTDQETGLIWLQDGACLSSLDFVSANAAALALHDGVCGLTDGSVAGQWRLPTKAEWQATIARAQALGCYFALTDNSGAACYGSILPIGPGLHERALWGAYPFLYWSSSYDLTFPRELAVASCVYFRDGGIVQQCLTEATVLGAWAVRDGR